jgi:hypothetical protein
MVVSDMDKATEEVECIENEPELEKMNEKKNFNSYFS